MPSADCKLFQLYRPKHHQAQSAHQVSMSQRDMIFLSPLPVPFDDCVDDQDESILSGASEIQIESHTIHRGRYEVTFRVKFRYSLSCPWYRAWADEIDLQILNQDVVLEYWRGLGGRYETTQLEWYKVLGILSEERGKYRVQWVGYGEKETSLEPKKKIMCICPKAVAVWEMIRSMD
ncbi:hypothetical protein FOXYSP1_19453 [Fusarium oxysporum f. sp. phaseoli]